MNLQESIRRILREGTDYLRIIQRRVPNNDLEREFAESLDMASNMLFNLDKNGGGVMNLDRFINLTISITIDGIHHELFSKLPEDIPWYNEVKETLKDYYKGRIEVRYRKLISKM